MSSTNNENGLVLTRKLTPSEKQRRKQLIAEAAKHPKSTSIKNKTSQSQKSSVPKKTLSCFEGMDSTDNKDFGKVDNNSTKSSQISTIDLTDTGFIFFVISHIFKQTF